MFGLWHNTVWLIVRNCSVSYGHKCFDLYGTVTIILYKMEDKKMVNDRRPDDMVRITTPELAQAFIDEQIAIIKEQVGDKKVLLALCTQYLLRLMD